VRGRLVLHANQRTCGRRYGKWLKEGNMWSNIIAVGNLNPSTTSLHGDNFTIVIAEAAWLLLTIAAVVAVFFRRTHYDLFQYTHHLVWLFMFGALIHAWSHWYYVAGGLTLYALDKVSRMVRASREVTVLHMAHAAGVTRLEVDAGVFAGSGGHYAGQYAFVNIPALGFLEWHPFTISAAPQETCETNNRVVTFHIKDMGPGTWTHRLAQLALAAPNPNNVIVSIDGPYGRTGHYYERETLILIAGGIGITPIHSIIADLHNRLTNPDAYGSIGAVKHVHVVWVVREARLLHIFANTLADILRNNPDSVFSLHLHCTESAGPGGSVAISGGPGYASDGLTIEPSTAGFCDPSSASIVDRARAGGRPDLPKLFTHVAAEAQKDHAARIAGGGGAFSPAAAVTVMVCGPERLIDQASDLSFAHGFDFHSEVFHF